MSRNGREAIDPRMIEAPEGASSLQLYQLKALIEGVLADPRRGIKAPASLHLGQPVQFVDFRDGQMRPGKIIAMRDTQATVLEEGTKRTWKIPCMAMQHYIDAERRNVACAVPHAALRTRHLSSAALTHRLGREGLEAALTHLTAEHLSPGRIDWRNTTSPAQIRHGGRSRRKNGLGASSL